MVAFFVLWFSILRYKGRSLTMSHYYIPFPHFMKRFWIISVIDRIQKFLPFNPYFVAVKAYRSELVHPLNYARFPFYFRASSITTTVHRSFVLLYSFPLILQQV